MSLNKVSAQNAANQSNRAQSLLIEEMAVWYPAPYYDVGAILSEETKGFKSSRRAKSNARGK